MIPRRTVIAVLAVAAVLTGCQTSTPGTPVMSPKEPTEPSFPASRPTRPTAAPPQTLTPTSTVPAPGGQVLTPENGYVFIETKSGQTRCQLNENEVDCEAQFTNPPDVAGLPANGVRLTPDGEISWVVGNLGAIPAVTLDYRTYSAVGWTIDAREDGTRFTNDSTGHGMNVAIDGVQAF